MRDTEKFPTKFGPATTRMPPLPNLQSKRKSTWQTLSPETRGTKGPKRMRTLRTERQRSAARKQTRTSRQINRRTA